MLESDFHYTLELHTESGKSLGQVAVEVDFLPAFEWTRLEGIRKGNIDPSQYDAPASIEPLWHSRLSQPYLEGFRIKIDQNNAAGTYFDFSTEYFNRLAVDASALFIKNGKMKSGEKFHHIPAAFPRISKSGSNNREKFKIENLVPEIPVRGGLISDFDSAALPQGERDSFVPPVFIPKYVLDEAASLTQENDEIETGGILIGHLHQDHRLPEMFVEVTAQIPITNGGELAKLNFSAETWTSVRSTIELRRSTEIMLGWWHSHPMKHWACKDCPPERRRVCAITGGFFSEHDRALHRTVFSRAWCIAIVANNVASDDLTFSVFGWNRGMIKPRGYSLLNEAAPDRQAVAASRNCHDP